MVEFISNFLYNLIIYAVYFGIFMLVINEFEIENKTGLAALITCFYVELSEINRKLKKK